MRSASDEAAQRITACVPGRRVVVFVADKKVSLPLTAADPAPAAPSPIEMLAQQLSQRDEETRSVIAEAMARVDKAVQVGAAVVASTAQREAEMAQSIAQITTVLALPVKPVYDKSGKLLGAQRVTTLGEK